MANNIPAGIKVFVSVKPVANIQLIIIVMAIMFFTFCFNRIVIPSLSSFNYNLEFINYH